MPLSLTLTPNTNKSAVRIGDTVRVSVVEIRGNRVRVSIEAPPEVLIYLESVVNKPDFVPASEYRKRQHVR